MRKFARSIGSEGKSYGNREGQCPLNGGRIVRVFCGFGHGIAACDCFLSGRLLFRGGATYLPVARGVVFTGGEPKIANSELLTMGNPTV